MKEGPEESEKSNRWERHFNEIVKKNQTTEVWKY
jgi:hypothetical protein